VRKQSARRFYIAVDAVLGHFASNGCAGVCRGPPCFLRRQPPAVGGGSRRLGRWAAAWGRAAEAGPAFAWGNYVRVGAYLLTCKTG
jgi:hypothetical protein